MAHEIHFTQVLLSSRTSSARHVIPVFWFGHLTTRVNPQTICLRQKLPYRSGDENSTNVQLSRCIERRQKYSKEHMTEDAGVSLSPYSELLTELYEKYPDSRSAPGNQYRRTLSGSVRKVAKRSRIVMLRHSLAPEKRGIGLRPDSDVGNLVLSEDGAFRAR